MDILLTVPPHFAGHIKKHKGDFSFISAVYSDPAGKKLGSGGGTVNVLFRHFAVLPLPGKCIIIHSDGQSRRLPAYAATGKSFIPVPVTRDNRGQRFGQTLADLQLPLLEKILRKASAVQNTLVVSGDALVRTGPFQAEIPQADVVCVGVHADAITASKHGVFVVSREDPSILEYMLQKPATLELQEIAGERKYLLDAGIWLLSDHAVEVLFRETGWDQGMQKFSNGMPGHYDLYTGLGSKLGSRSSGPGELSARIIALEDADFYHFGSNADLVRSAGKLCNGLPGESGRGDEKTGQGREIFVQNSVTGVHLEPGNSPAWIENSCIPEGWTLHDHHILTGIPDNEWRIDLPAGVCLDFVPVGATRWCIRPYGFHDIFRGEGIDRETCWMNRPMMQWFDASGFTKAESAPFFERDIFEAKLFPVFDEREIDGNFIRWLVQSPPPGGGSSPESYKSLWLSCRRLSAPEIMEQANLTRLIRQRKRNQLRSLPALANEHGKATFYQLDLGHLAAKFRSGGLPLPLMPEQATDTITQINDLMFRSAWHGKRFPKTAREMELLAFTKLREGMVENLKQHPENPRLNMQPRQVIRAVSPLRLDLAGGWTDTPPYCVMFGGKVVNMAVDLDGKPPVQVTINLAEREEIAIHSVDQDQRRVIRTYDEMRVVSKVGSAFSIPMAALMLAGFYPGFSVQSFPSLQDQLKEFGGGLDISLKVDVPKGSGLGTSSILAASLLGGLSELCSLGWDRHETAYRTLLLEQLLTTGGGWQDQFGGIY
ncbi:MAG: L-fucokinase, partial [Bacteroidota bacterium]